MNKMIGFIEKHVSWKRLLVLVLGSGVLATFIVTMLFGFIKLDPDAIMDSSFYYTSNTFYNYLDLQGDIGRKSYLYLHLIDYIFILFFYPSLAVMVYMLQKYIDLNFTKYLLFIPLSAGDFDVLENLCIDISILFYPSKIGILANLSGYFTAIKMTLIYLTFIIIILLIMMILIKKVKILIKNI